MIIHVMFCTYHFGVNNKWWWEHRSIFGKPWHKRFNLIINYEMARFRACHVYFVDEETANMLFPRYLKKRSKKWNI